MIRKIFSKLVAKSGIFHDSFLDRNFDHVEKFRNKVLSAVKRCRHPFRMLEDVCESLGRLRHIGKEYIDR